MPSYTIVSREKTSASYLAAPEQVVVAAAAENGQKATDKIFGPGLSILQLYMQLLSQQAGGYHRDMSASGRRANEAQNMVSDVDAAIAEIDIDEKHKPVNISEKLIIYLLANRKFVEGIEFDDEKDGWSKENLVKVRGNIQKYATQNSDAVSQSQLQVQKIMQTYNVTVGLMNSLQTLMGDMNKMFAQATR